MSSYANVYTWNDLTIRRGTYFVKGDNAPFTGTVKTFHKNGQLFDKSHVVDGKEEGIHEVFYENGQLHVKEILLNGKREGLFEMYFKNGRRKLRCFYINDEHESIECWDRKGSTVL
jgi:Uncharacterized protein conserved in bacteria